MIAKLVAIGFFKSRMGAISAVTFQFDTGEYSTFDTGEAELFA